MKLLGLIGVVAACIAAGQSTRGVLQARAVAELDRYLADYEPKLSALVADEVFHQESPPLTEGGLRPLLKRRLDSEIAFARLPGDMNWIGFRRVMKVDGVAVAQTGPTLAALLSVGATDRVAQAQLLVMQSSEHNLGLPRTTNLPNLPLELLQPKYRGRFTISLGDSDRIRGRTAFGLMFTELAQPSIVSNGGREGLLSRMQVWVDTATGAILRARVRLTGEGIPDDPEIAVEFEEHKTLGLLVPVRMDERFLIARSAAGKGRATYSNFRRFQTSARILPQNGGTKVPPLRPTLARSFPDQRAGHPAFGIPHRQGELLAVRCELVVTHLPRTDPARVR